MGVFGLPNFDLLPKMKSAPVILLLTLAACVDSFLLSLFPTLHQISPRLRASKAFQRTEIMDKSYPFRKVGKKLVIDVKYSFQRYHVI
jgi:hypothetical protein